MTRGRLVQACWEVLLDASGSGVPVTVAAVCRAARCTPPTLYHHFASLAELQRTACQEAFAGWADGIEGRIGTAVSPAQRLRLRGRAYLEWGIANPVAYRVLFLQPQGTADPDAGPGRGFDTLAEDLSLLMDRSPADPAVRTAALAHWSAVHGLTSLLITNPDLPAPTWRAVLDHLADALATAAVDLPKP